MTGRNEPLVSVVTPVYNGEAFLKDCIESVVAQTYENFEYTLVNNCSTDRSLEIALEYAAKDSRIRVHSNLQHVDIIANHNIAFGFVSPEAKYCKVVSADDTIFPECISRMVELAEAHPSVGIVGCYQISGNKIRWQDFPYPQNILNGKDLCRRALLGNDKFFGFGAPTSLLYRADLVRKTDAFFPCRSPHADTSALYANLKDCDFGFVYQILCWERLHEGTETVRSAKMNEVWPSSLSDIIHYGRYYLSEDEYQYLLRRTLDAYYEFLSVSAIRFREKAFWDHHKTRLGELGYTINVLSILKAGAIKAVREVTNPFEAVRKLRSRPS